MTEAVGARQRPSRLPRSARRAQLLDVALGVFVEQGYHSASMDEIAERAGVSKPVLYQHFPGKLDLYLALLETSCDTVIAEVRAALASTTDNRKRVRATMDLWYGYVADQGAAFRLVFESDLTNDPSVRSQIDRVIDESATDIAAVISEDTGLPAPAAHLLAVSLVGMGHVGAQNWMSHDSSLSRAEAVELVAGLAWRGIGGFPQDRPKDSPSDSVAHSNQGVE